MKKISFAFIFPVLLLSVSCADLNVKPDQPGPGDILQTPEELLDASAKLYRGWFNAAHALKGPALGLATAADQITTTSGEAAAVDLAKEPREEFQNQTDYSFLYVTKDFWGTSYQVILLANDVLRSMEGKEIILYNGQDIKPMLTAWSYFVRGIGYGYLGLLFDKAPLQDIHTPLPNNEYSDYHQVIRFALASLDSAIVISNKHAFSLPANFISGVAVSSDDLSALAGSFAARILLSSSRNLTENEVNDWQRILDYASGGISQDLSPVTDNDTWKDEYRQYAASTNWGRVDLRIIHLLDPGFPAHWPDDNASWETPGGQAPDSSLLESNDARAVTDLAWDPPATVNPPYYLNSFYRCRRYDNWLASASGSVPEFTQTENELIMAEALVHLGNTAEAVDILNSGTRTQRGQLAPLDVSLPVSDVLEAIFYERDIELMLTGVGLPFFDMRRRDMLQKGTPLHFPIPASDLEILGLPVYTFGGVDHADGINTSNGGWNQGN